MYKEWPKNRGIFYDKETDFSCWVNEEDHCRFIWKGYGATLANGIKLMAKNYEVV